MDENISCAVLEDGRRMLVERSVAKAIGRKGDAEHWKRKREKKPVLPEYLSAKYLEPYIGTDLRDALLSPVKYHNASRGITHYGIEARHLVAICDVWIKAQKDGVLGINQLKIAEKAYVLLSAFASVGIVALIDEATGYQGIRQKDALQAILDKYLTKERATWAKRFPDEFYKELFRLKGWTWLDPKALKRPSCVVLVPIYPSYYLVH